MGCLFDVTQEIILCFVRPWHFFIHIRLWKHLRLFCIPKLSKSRITVTAIHATVSHILTFQKFQFPGLISAQITRMHLKALFRNIFLSTNLVDMKERLHGKEVSIEIYMLLEITLIPQTLTFLKNIFYI